MVTDFRCPACSATETMFVKWALSWSVGWFGKLGQRKVGACVVCLRCDEPFVVTPTGTFRKRKAAPAAAFHPTQVVPGNDRAAVVQAAINALPDEPA